MPTPSVKRTERSLVEGMTASTFLQLYCSNGMENKARMLRRVAHLGDAATSPIWQVPPHLRPLNISRGSSRKG